MYHARFGWDAALAVKIVESSAPSLAALGPLFAPPRALGLPVPHIPAPQKNWQPEGKSGLWPAKQCGGLSPRAGKTANARLLDSAAGGLQVRCARLTRRCEARSPLFSYALPDVCGGLLGQSGNDCLEMGRHLW